MSAAGTEPALPPFAARVGNARRAAQRILARAARGQRLGVSSEEARRRLAICAGCGAYRASDKTCAECGCYIAAKARLASERCPAGKWRAKKGQEHSVAVRRGAEPKRRRCRGCR